MDLIDSIRKLLDYRFEWVLAGHGDRDALLGWTKCEAQLWRWSERRRDRPVVAP